MHLETKRRTRVYANGRTGAGSHLSAFASEPARSLFLPLLSHFLLKSVKTISVWKGRTCKVGTNRLW